MFSFSILSNVCQPVNFVERFLLIPPANEVWGEIICLQVCVRPQWGVPGPGGACWGGGVPGPGGVPAPRGSGLGGCLVWGMSALRGGAWSWRRGCLLLGGLVQGVPGPGGGTCSPGLGLVQGVPGGDPLPPDGHYCRWYASYCNTF